MSIRELAPRGRVHAALSTAASVCVLILVLAPRPGAASADVDHGRYLIVIGGCNDCHTPGYIPSEGAVPEAQWLTGDVLGWRGPWGTTYAANLRLYMQGISEDGWLVAARNMRPLPPMPWFNVRQMTDDDLRAIYRFVRALGPAGVPAPAFVPPEQTPAPPFVQFP